MELPEHPVAFSLLLTASRLANWNTDKTNELLAAGARCAAEIESALPEVPLEQRSDAIIAIGREWVSAAELVRQNMLDDAVAVLDALSSRARLHMVLPPVEGEAKKAAA
jgi:hypothetical protein